MVRYITRTEVGVIAAMILLVVAFFALNILHAVGRI